MADKFLSRIGGVTKSINPAVASTGSADAGRVIATGPDGKVNTTFLPSGIGAPTISAPASEKLSAGKYVNIFEDTGAVKVRLADNSNGRPAHGFVKASVLPAETATVFGLGVINADHTGLTPGSLQYLGTAGGVISVPLDGADPLKSGFVCQELGVAVSATEVLTSSNSYVLL